MLSLCNFLVFRDTYAQTLFLVSLRRALKHKRIVLSMSHKFLKRWLKFSRELVGKEYYQLRIGHYKEFKS